MAYLIDVFLVFLCVSCNAVCLFVISEWCAEYRQNRPDVKKMQSEIDQFMQEYDKKVEEVKLHE